MPSALAIQMSRPSRSALPFGWTAKSTIVVVPPWAAAFVPLSKVSLAKVPPKGSSKWVWASMPPGTTYFPVASIVRVGGHARRGQVGPHEGDRLAVDEDVGRVGAVGGDDEAVGDQRAHRTLLRPWPRGRRGAPG